MLPPPIRSDQYHPSFYILPSRLLWKSQFYSRKPKKLKNKLSVTLSSLRFAFDERRLSISCVKFEICKCFLPAHLGSYYTEFTDKSTFLLSTSYSNYQSIFQLIHVTIMMRINVFGFQNFVFTTA